MAQITKAELANKLDISKSRITAYIRRGMPVLRSGKLDEDVCLRWVQKTIGPRIEPGATAGAKLTNVRARRELARAQIAELELEALRAGKLSVGSAKDLADRLNLAAISARQQLGIRLSAFVHKRLGLGDQQDTVWFEIEREVQYFWEPVQRIIEILRKMGGGEPAPAPSKEFVSRVEVGTLVNRLIIEARSVLLALPDEVPVDSHDVVKQGVHAALSKLAGMKFGEPDPEKTA